MRASISTIVFILAIITSTIAQDRITLSADPSYISGNGSGLQTWDDGVTIRTTGLEGTPATLVYDTEFQDRGFGIAGARWDQIDFYEIVDGVERNASEKFEILFNGNVRDVVLTVGMIGLNEGRNGNDETGKWSGYNEQGVLVAEGLLGPEQSTLGADVKISGTYGQYPIALTSSVPLYRIVVEATGFGYGQGEPRSASYGENNSDFNIAEVSYVRVTNGSPSNTAPIAVDDDFFEIREDIGPTGIDYTTLLRNDSDPDGDNIRITGFDFTGFPGEIVDQPDDKSILFTTEKDFSGEITFTYTITDGQATDQATVTITVLEVSEKPIAGNDGPFTTQQNTPVAINIAELLSNDREFDGDEVRFTGIEEVENGSAVAEDGSVVFTPAPDFVGQASFRYSITSGTTLSETTVSNPVIIEVEPGEPTENRPPVAADDDFFEIREDIGPTGIRYETLLRNDSDPDGDPLRIVGFNFFGFPGEITNLPDDESILFTTDQDFNGEINIGYVLSDGKTTSLGLITITVLQVLDDPIIGTDGPFTTEQNVPLTVSTESLLANDRDPDEGDVITFRVIEDTQNGAATVSNGTITFTPDADFVGLASFSYSIVSTTTIGNSQFTDVAVSKPVVVDVLAPTASVEGSFVLVSKVDESSSTLQVNGTGNRTSAVVEICDEGQVWSISKRSNGFYKITNTLADKALEAWRPSPANGDDVTIYSSNNKDWQQWEILEAGNGFYRIKGKYNPRFLTLSNGNAIVADEDGSDNQLWKLVAPSEINCTAATNAAPIAVDDDFFEIREDIGPTGIDYETLLRNDSDPDGDNIRITGFDFAGFPGEIVDQPDDKSILFTTEKDFSGEITFTYTITDGQATDQATILITVLEVIDPVEPDPIMLTAADLSLDGTTGEQVWGACATVRAQDAQGNPAALERRGDRVGPATGRYNYQLDYDPVAGTTERIFVDFGRPVETVSVQLGNLEVAEYQGLNETGFWIGYDADGTVVAEGIIGPALGTRIDRGVYRFALSGTGIATLELGATAYGGGQGTERTSNNSDFSLMEVMFTSAVACSSNASSNQAINSSLRKMNLEVTAFPNPVRDQLTVRSSSPSEAMRLWVYNAQGTLVKTLTTRRGQQSTFDMSDLTSGVYLIQAVSPLGTRQLRFVKK